MSLLGTRRGGKKKESKEDEYGDDYVEYEEFKSASNRIKKLEEMMEVVLEANREQKCEIAKIKKEMNRKEARIEELSAELNLIKGKNKEIGGNLVEQEREIKQMKQEAEIVTKASNILEQKEEMEENLKQANQVVNVCKEEAVKTYAEIMKQKDEIITSIKKDTEKIDIKKEVKNVIRQNAKFVKDTVDMNKAIVIHGLEDKEIRDRITRDKEEIKNITEIVTSITKDEEGEVEMEEFHRLGRYESNQTRPLKVILTQSNMVETVLKNARKLKDSDEWNHIRIHRCLTKEDRELLKDKREEAKQKNEDRTDEEERHFFYRVVGMQVKKWWITRRDGN